MTLDLDGILAGVNEVLGPGRDRQVALHAPRLRGNENKYLTECIETGWVSSVGAFVDRFERMLADYTGARFAIAVVNGTSALHTALLLAGVRPGDEVLIPTLTFVATANAVHYCGAIPHLVDCEWSALGIDAEKLERYLISILTVRDGITVNRTTGRPVRAIVPVHIFGHPSDLDALARVSERFQVTMVEDATESLGSFYQGKHTGNHGLLAVLSFNGNKIVTTGGGGAILTNNEDLAGRARYITTTAKRPHAWKYFHDQIGFNYRMPNVNAAIGCAQLEQLDDFVKSKRAIAERYQDVLGAMPGLRIFREPAFARSNYWLNALVLDQEHTARRDELLERFHRDGILARPAWVPMHRLPMYQNSPAMDLSTSEEVERSLINLPSSP